MKLYMLVVLFFLLAGLVFGVVAPFLVSAASSELVLLGGALMIATVPALAYIGYRAYQEGMRILETKTEDES